MPRKSSPLAGWPNADAQTWFNTLLHAQQGGSIIGALAMAHPVSWGHWGMTPGVGQKQAPVQQRNLLELLGLHSADSASTAVPEPPPKTRRPFPLGP